MFMFGHVRSILNSLNKDKPYFNSGGKYKSKENKKILPAYQMWRDMCRRCFDDEVRATQPYYETVTIDKSWTDFQNFAPWYYSNFVEEWELDKDLFSGEAKRYAPETCCFLPRRLNGWLERIRSIKSGETLGYSYHSRDLVYNVRLRDSSDKLIHLGYFKSEKEARFAYVCGKVAQLESLLENYREDLPPRTFNKLTELKNELAEIGYNEHNNFTETKRKLNDQSIRFEE
jgi:hypothetical protein